MMLDAQVAAMLAQAQAAGLPDLADLPPPAARVVYRQILAAADVPPADVAVRDEEGFWAGSAVRVRWYRPHGITQALPTVLYFHGGGYTLGDLDGYDAVCRQLCADSGAMVVSAAYRLAPEHPFPAAPEDAWAALNWVSSVLAQRGGDAARLAVAGDSAGAALAASVALRARDAGGPALCLQLLLYPPAAGGHEGDYPSRQRHGQGPTITLRTMAYFNRHYFGEAGCAPDERGAPLLARDLSGLPPTLLMLAGHDPLRDEGLAYGEALQAAGNLLTVVEYLCLPHGFVSMGAVPAARLAQLQMAAGLRQAFGG